MYIIKDYMTNETVAIATRKQDAIAMTTGNRRAGEPILVYEKSK